VRPSDSTCVCLRGFSKEGRSASNKAALLRSPAQRSVAWGWSLGRDSRTRRLKVTRPGFGQAGKERKSSTGASLTQVVGHAWLTSVSPRHLRYLRYLCCSAVTQQFLITESQNHRVVGAGRDLCGSPSPTPCQSRVTQSRLHSTASRRVLNISREGDSTASLGNYVPILQMCLGLYQYLSLLKNWNFHFPACFGQFSLKLPPASCPL